nr:glutamate synthase subunit alpha [Pseudomonadota bacterium]
MSRINNLPESQGLYNPNFEHDACGVGMVVNLRNLSSHKVVEQGISLLKNLEHRGASGSDEKTGDGCGILSQIPHRYFLKLFFQDNKNIKQVLPEPGNYGVGVVFLPQDRQLREYIKSLIFRVVEENGENVFAFLPVKVNSTVLGEEAKKSEPVIERFFVTKNQHSLSTNAYERKLFIIRRQIEKSLLEVNKDDRYFHITSFSSRTITHKGLLPAERLSDYYLELQDPNFESTIALVHQRFSTNTFPSWNLSHPFRMICHNGEINTIRNNVNSFNARESLFQSKYFNDDLQKVLPLIPEGISDSATLDAVVEFLYHSGRSLPHVISMLIPEAWEKNENMDPLKRSFYEYNSCLIEPWDGPALVAFTDGKYAGATLDRNGLRPARYT